MSLAYMRILVIVMTLIAVLLPTPPAEAEVIYPIIFPVAGTNHYSDTFGAPRAGGRTHEGTDIMAAKMTPVVAAAAGTVGWVSSECCAMELIHDDGYRSRYIHLNNDTEGTDDGQGWGFAPGIGSGSHVEAGQLIGWVGDSGNAEFTASHLHFELRDQNGTAFNSYPSLHVATPPDVSTSFWATAAVVEGDLVDFDPTVALPVHADLAFPFVGDFDGDGQSEVAVGGQPSRGVDVAELDGDATSWSDVFGATPSQTVVGDFDGDGDDDIATMAASGSWTGYRSSGSSFATGDWGRHKGKPWQDFIVGDFDGDGADEIVAFHPPSATWWISQLTSTGWVHTAYAQYKTTAGWQIHLSADVDGDGRDEILSFHPSNGTWWSTGVGESSRLVTNLRTNTGWQHLVALDVDGDGVDEIVQYHPGNGTWWEVDPSISPAQISLWAKFKTRTGWEHPTVIEDQQTLAIRHDGTGNIWAITGIEGELDYVGRMLPGSLEGFWSAGVNEGHGFVALRRN